MANIFGQDHCLAKFTRTLDKLARRRKGTPGDRARPLHALSLLNAQAIGSMAAVVGSPANKTLKLTGVAILVSRGVTHLQAAPAA